MKHPKELKYTKDHEWIRLENDIAFIGITDFAQSQLGDIIYVDINNTLNTIVNKSEVFGVVEAVKIASDLYLPVTGYILEINQKISDPESLNSNPYDVWLVKIRIENISEFDDLMSSEEYTTYCGL